MGVYEHGSAPLLRATTGLCQAGHEAVRTRIALSSLATVARPLQRDCARPPSLVPLGTVVIHCV